MSYTKKYLAANNGQKNKDIDNNKCSNPGFHKKCPPYGMNMPPAKLYYKGFPKKSIINLEIELPFLHSSRSALIYS
jgi:hypothetical protein